MKTEPVWKTAKISPNCEVMIGGTSECPLFCDKPTTHAYPAWGGGFMALCFRHAQKHLKHGGAISTDELIKNGETWA